MQGLVPVPSGTAPLSPSYLFTADGMYRRPPQQTAVVALANSKGGVAKTTSALNLAFALSQTHSKRVLVIDMDGQSSLTEALPPKNGPKPGQVPGTPASITALLSGRVDMKSLVLDTNFDRLWIVPASADMIIADAGGGPNPVYELRFAQALHDPLFVAPDGGSFDWILLDTPPAQTIYTRMALAASHFVLIPTNADALSVRGATFVLRTVKTMRALIGQDVKVLYGFITEWASHPNAAKEIDTFVDALHAADLSTTLFEEKIPRDPKVDKAHLETMKGGLRTLIFGHGPAANAYEALAKGMLKYVSGN
jgi:chromosome partitioning protein